LSSSDNPQFDPQLSPGGGSQVPAPLAADPLLVAGLPQISPAPAPVENPVFNGWDVLLIVGLTLLTAFVVQVTVTVGANRLLYPHLDFSEVLQKPILLLLSQLLIYVAVAAYMIFLVEGKYHAPFWPAIRWNWPGAAWKPLALGVALLFALNLLQVLLPMPKDTPFEKLFARPRDAYLISLIAVSLGPLMEELFFRGLLYPVLARRIGVFWGILLTALPFGLIHLQQYGYAWGAVLVVFLVGVVCTAVRAATKSVGASFLVHVGYNGTQMLIALVYTGGFRHMEKVAWVLLGLR
jgi:uncharacterized protein